MTHIDSSTDQNCSSPKKTTRIEVKVRAVWGGVRVSTRVLDEGPEEGSI